MTDELRIDILKKVENGELDLEKASELLALLDQRKSASSSLPEMVEPINSQEEVLDPLPEEAFEKPGWAFVYWLVPFLFGGVITAFSATWLYQSYTEAGMGWRFWLSWVPLVIGIFLIYLGFVLQSAKWLHINIRQPAGQSPQKIVFGFPLPMRFAGGLLKLFKGRFPEQTQAFSFDEIFDALDNDITRKDPLIVNVDDEDGTSVEIYIG